MEDQQQGAALPWAAAQEQQEGEAIEPDLPSKLGLQLGQRVEVKWLLEIEDEQQEHSTKWWGAVLDSRPQGETDGEGRQVYVLRYDADPASGFTEQEVRKVTFVEEHLLYDLSEDDDLVFRKEGETWEEPEPPAGAAAAADALAEGEGGEGPVYALSDIAAAIHKSERRRGRTLEQDTAEALSAFPQDKQMFIAAGFRNFSDHIAAAMAKLHEQHGPGYVVTAADVKAATQAAMQAALGGGM